MTVNPQAPAAQNITDEVVLSRGGFESSFFKSDLTDPQSDFSCAFFGKYRFKPFQISFFSGFLYHDHVLSQMVL